MNELQYNKKYYLDYLLGTKFDRRMYDIYIGMSNPGRPPYLDEILRENTQMQALLILEEFKHNPDQLSLLPSQWEQIQEQVWQDDEVVKLQVLEFAMPNQLEKAFYDIFSYLEYNRLSVLVRAPGTYRVNESKILNAPVVEIW